MAQTNGAHAALAPGHFLFTSESVGEGHPGMKHPFPIIAPSLPRKTSRARAVN